MVCIIKQSARKRSHQGNNGRQERSEAEGLGHSVPCFKTPGAPRQAGRRGLAL